MEKNQILAVQTEVQTDSLNLHAKNIMNVVNLQLYVMLNNFQNNYLYLVT